MWLLADILVGTVLSVCICFSLFTHTLWYYLCCVYIIKCLILCVGIQLTTFFNSVVYSRMLSMSFYKDLAHCTYFLILILLVIYFSKMGVLSGDIPVMTFFSLHYPSCALRVLIVIIL